MMHMPETIHFVKYQALGNDYLVVEPGELHIPLTPALVRWMCDRHYGAGSDGLLVGPQVSPLEGFTVSIYNPDGSGAEKSGNGLRIFARYLWDSGVVGAAPFTILTPGGQVTAQVLADGHLVTVDMGQISFDSARVPVAGPSREVLNEVLEIDGHALRFCAATIGNPHCVILRNEARADEARRWGPRIAQDARFLHRTNVQFMQVLDRQHIRIEIWERGAGYTLASGSSCCAAAAVAHRLGLCDREITVAMPGGALDIAVHSDWTITMRGPVIRIAEGTVSPEAFSDLLREP
jgi:diaminopimelate epimerase